MSDFSLDARCAYAERMEQAGAIIPWRVLADHDLLVTPTLACLPVGMQVIGRRYADADVLAACAAFERARPWRDNYDIPANRSLS